MQYDRLLLTDPEQLIFGAAPCPVETERGLIIGGGRVYPEINFTLPTMEVSSDTLGEMRSQYEEIVEDVLERAVRLNSRGLVIEFETLLEMTKEPDLGVELLQAMNEICERYYQKHGLATEIRLTPNDLREFDRPPKQRTSSYLEPMFELFDRGAKAGGTLLSIESTGGKEISDDALMMCDITQFIFSQSVLGVNDMRFLWSKITEIAETNDAIAGGDTACGFGNTAMVLAEKEYIPKIFAAIARIATVLRTLICIEEGATGPDKDCGYEGPFLKAITGIPISMEGKTAACAHLSPVGNVAAAAADLWSNESVQNVKLLSGWAPVAYYEQLEYDVRLMNEAREAGREETLTLQRLLVHSDIRYDPQALILAPENVIRIASQIIKGTNYIEASVLGCLAGLDIIREALDNDTLKIEEKELMYIDILQNDLENIPLDESAFIEQMLPAVEDKIFPEEYGL